MNRTLLPKEGIVAFSCGLAGKYIDDKNDNNGDNDNSERVSFEKDGI